MHAGRDQGKSPIHMAGYPSRHCLPGVGGISDIPAFWDKRQMEVAEGLSALHEYYTKGPHFEAGVCFDLEDERDCFTYMAGVGVGEADGETPQLPGVYHHVIPGGLYAVLTTPWARKPCIPKRYKKRGKTFLKIGFRILRMSLTEQERPTNTTMNGIMPGCMTGNAAWTSVSRFKNGVD